MDAFGIRDIDAGLEAVFFDLYAAVRTVELAMEHWDAPMRDRILHLQFNAQRLGAAGAGSAPRERLILHEDAPIGWVIACDADGALCCVDIAILPAHRRQGAGGYAMRALQRQAQTEGRPVVLQVLRSNVAARAFYDRLGFTAQAQDDVHLHLTWQA